MFGQLCLLLQDEAVVTAHEVKGKVDYNKLCEQFGCSIIPASLVDRIERVTGVPAHPFLKRGVFYAHRDLDQLLDLYEQGKKFYLYTGATVTQTPVARKREETATALRSQTLLTRQAQLAESAACC